MLVVYVGILAIYAGVRVRFMNGVIGGDNFGVIKN